MNYCGQCNKWGPCIAGNFHYGKKVRETSSGSSPDTAATATKFKVAGSGEIAFCLDCINALKKKITKRMRLRLVLELFAGTLLFLIGLGFIGTLQPEWGEVIWDDLIGLGLVTFWIYLLGRTLSRGLKLKSGPLKGKALEDFYQLLDKIAIRIFKEKGTAQDQPDFSYWTRLEYSKSTKPPEKIVEKKQTAKPEKAAGGSGQILVGAVMIALFGFLSWLQMERINEDSYWIIFRVWFIPIPIMLLTGIGFLGGIVVFFQGLTASLKNSFSKVRKKGG